MASAAFEIVVTAHNYDRIRKALATMASKEWYRGIIRDTAREILPEWVQYTKRITHKLTGLLSESFTWSYDSHRSEGKVFINPRSVAKRGQSTVIWPKLYGPYEHARGGSHAFFARTLSDRGHRALEVGFRALARGIPEA